MARKQERSSRDALIEAGLEVMLSGSYERAGLQEILARAKVPKGSFYHHFSSKEGFGLAVVGAYAEKVQAIFRRHLSDAQRAPIERMSRLFKELEKRLVAEGCQGGCLMGSIAQEQADVSEAFRSHLQTLFAEQQELLANCLAEARDRGELDRAADPQALAAFCVSAWQGALLQMKLSRSPEPLKRFRTIVFGRLLAA